ncbi:MAG TPA: CheR family methyltransferase [Nitrosomonas europaea]|uniref:CheR family methyltransferase n=1 Tax=Nitrosomonas europaea TaxID=915 RepID=UPI002491F4BF|nr:CheR family methyltransferase [Nitrosomonas europaea]HRN82990.1 CheR family methyltransferase [Nitrosomonas europaea]HRO57381.1 CheR family methyltransferase [Nitrosomonas europaea]HRQ09235.1 CheR family methyltransferase [Nitrosomonas europaea]HUM74963.1 CheR family methyltransferase [Nitrosomonas europaea]
MNARASGEHNTREYAFSSHDFECVKKLIYARAGIALAENRQEMVYTRLSRRLRATGSRGFGEYLERLEGDDRDAEWESFVNALTTNLTSFFREAHHFPILAEHVKKRQPGQTMKLWCSAASTGEEPYSMAMTMVEAFDSLKPPVRILATDIDTEVLAVAREGVYSLDRLESMSPERIRRFFLKGKNGTAGYARVRQELRDLITFKPLNLLDPKYPMRGSFDAIFCRNIMIYFDKPTQYRILQKFVPLLDRDGLLFMGHSEVFQHASDLIKLIDRTVYKLVVK